MAKARHARSVREAAGRLLRAAADPDPAAVIREMRDYLGPHFTVEHGIRETTTAAGRVLVFYVTLDDVEGAVGVETTSEVPEGLLAWAGEGRADLERGVWSALAYEAPMALSKRLEQLEDRDG